MDTVKADHIIENTLRNGNLSLAQELQTDVMILMAPMLIGIDDVVRDEVESIVESREDGEPPINKLTVILETDGGYIETVERIVSVFRRHYQEVDFIVPNFAYSAGTVLALSGDNIYMDYYSVLGPIDPQFRTESGETVPGMGYIAQYKELLEKINSAPEDQTSTVKAELAFLLKKFDPAKLFNIEQAIEHSRDLIRDWLPQYKFKNWKKTSNDGKTVDDAYKRERANKIAEKLGDASHWHSHGRGISMQELASEGIGLKIEDFGSDPKLNENVRHYYGLFSDYIRVIGCKSAVHTGVRTRRIG